MSASGPMSAGARIRFPRCPCSYPDRYPLGRTFGCLNRTAGRGWMILSLFKPKTDRAGGVRWRCVHNSADGRMWRANVRLVRSFPQLDRLLSTCSGAPGMPRPLRGLNVAEAPCAFGPSAPLGRPASNFWFPASARNAAAALKGSCFRMKRWSSLEGGLLLPEAPGPRCSGKE